jgi:hypothetical protein
VSDYHSCLLSNRIRWGYQPHQYGMTRSHDKSWKEIKKDVMLLFFFFPGGIGVWTQGFVLAKLALYRLGHTSRSILHWLIWR